MTTTRTPETSARTHILVMALCGAAIVFDGYDIVVYGTTLTELRREWDLDAGTAGLIGSSALVGMLVGAILVSSLANRWGRKRMFLLCIAWFSILMLCCAAAPGPSLFTALRFLAGIGLGGVMPLAAALTTEFSSPRRRNLSYVIMQSGYPVGGVIAALLAMWVIPHMSWHWMYVIAALPLVTVLPAACWFIPDSREESLGHSAGAVQVIFSPTFRTTTILFWAMSFCSLLFVYGANTWLPSLMEDAGHTATASLGFLLSFNAGAVAGGLVAGWAADAWGSRRIVVLSFLVGAVAVVGFSTATATLMLLTLAAFAGYGAVATQTLINGWVTNFYPPVARATGIGWSLGIGRTGAIIGPALTGAIVATTGGGTAAFLLFAGVGVIGAGTATAVQPQRASSTTDVEKYR